jgi:putative oxidoreductase
MKIITFYHVWLRFVTSIQSIFLLVIRLYWGFHFCMAGLGKFQNWDRTVGFFTSLGIPFPELNVGMAASTEFFGGALLLIGLGSRVITVPLIFTMIVAYGTAHTQELSMLLSDPEPFFAAAPFLFLYASVIVLLFGAGRFSVDYCIQKKFCKPTDGTDCCTATVE